MIGEVDIITLRYNEFKEVADHFEKNNDISTKNIIDNTFKKVLVLSIASYFEDKIKTIIIEHIEFNSDSELIKNFVKNTGLERKYHSYFSWDKNNANTFLGLFGDSFKTDIDFEIKKEPLKSSIKDFMELGRLRNELVHKNFAAFSIEKTPDEIYSLYLKADYFVSYLSEKLNPTD